MELPTLDVVTNQGQNLQAAFKPPRRSTLLKALQQKHGVEEDVTPLPNDNHERNLSKYLQENESFKPTELVPFYEAGTVLQGATAEVTCIAVEKGVFFSAGKKASSEDSNNNNNNEPIKLNNSRLGQSGMHNAHAHKDTEDLIIHGELLVAGCGDGSIYLWNRFKGKLLGKLEHRHAVSCLHLDGKVIWAAYEDRKIRCWGVTEQLLGKVSFSCDGWINSILADNNHVIACCNNKVILWKKPAESITPTATATDLEPKAIELPHDSTDRVTCVVKDANKSTLWSCGFDGDIYCWKNNGGEYVADCRLKKVHEDRILCLALQGTQLYSGSEDQTIRVIDVEKKEVIVSATIPCTGRIYSLFVSEQRIFASDSNDSVLVWNRENTQGVIQILKGQSRVHCLATDEVGRLYSGGDSSVQIWDHVPSKSIVSFIYHRKRISCMAVDEKYLYTGSFDHSVVVWDKTQPVIQSTYNGHSDKVSCLCVDEKYVYSGSYDGTVQIWDKNTGKCNKILTVEENSELAKFHCIGIQVDSARIYAIWGPFLLVWDKETGAVIAAESLPEEEALFHRMDSEISPKVLRQHSSFMDMEDDIPEEQVSIRLRHFSIDEGVIYVVVRRSSAIIRFNRANLELLPAIKSKLDEITCLGIDENNLYLGGKDCVVIKPKRIEEQKENAGGQSLSALDKTISLTDDMDSKYEKLKALYVLDKRMYCGFSHHIEIKDLETGETLSDTNADYDEGEWNIDCWNLLVDEGRIYSQSFSSLVKMIDLAIYDLPAYFRQVISSAPLGKFARGLVHERDSLGRTALSCCAVAGNIQNAFQLLHQGCKISLSHTHKPGEHSPLFFIFREQRWNFLKSFLDRLGYAHVDEDENRIHIDFHQDPEILRLLQNRARANDIKFFLNLFKFPTIKFDGRHILSEAIRLGHLELVKFWPHVNQTWALHEACFYGKPESVAILVNRDDIVRVNMQDHVNDRRTPLHVCFSSGTFSELNFPRKKIVQAVQKDANSIDWARWKANVFYWFTGTLRDTNFELASHCSPAKEWIDEAVFEKFEYNLILRRLECARILLGAKEASKRPNMLIQDVDGKTVYDKALELHEHTIKKSAKPRREIQEREQIQMSKTLFRETSKVCDELHNYSEIWQYRTSFANSTFFRMAGLFFVYLIILTAVSVLSTTNDEWRQYRMASAMTDTFMGDSFSGVNSVASFWGYVDGTLLPAIYTDDSTEFSQPGFVLGFNRVMGSVRFRQIQIRNDTCTIRNDFHGLLDTCYNFDLDDHDQYKEDYGPGGIYQWKHDGEELWSQNNIWYPRGGYFENLPPDNGTEASEIVSGLQANGWITRNTRLLIISFTVYNPNLHGVYAIMQLAFEFSAVGDITAEGKVFMVGPRAYDNSLGWIGIIKVIMELIVVLYIIREYLYQEAIEIYFSIAESVKESEQIELLRNPKSSARKKRSFFQRGLTWYERAEILSTVWQKGVRSGLVHYWTELWNYFEWGIILVFSILFILRFYCFALYENLNIDPTKDKYIDFLYYGQIVAYQQDLLAVFVLMNWVRLLKFLRIPTYTGPMVQSIMDTLTTRSVLVFFFIIFFELMAFSLAYFIAFGNDTLEYAAFGQSTMTLFQVIFGGFDYGPLAQSNRVFGPILFVIFMLSINLVLMNLLISVLSESYNTAQQVNEKRWNRYITLLMIETLPLRCKPSNESEYFAAEQTLGQKQRQNDAEVQKQDTNSQFATSISNSMYSKSLGRNPSFRTIKPRTFSDPESRKEHEEDDTKIFILDDGISSEASYDAGEDEIGAEEKIVLFQERRVDDWLTEDSMIDEQLVDEEDEDDKDNMKEDIAELKKEIAQLKEDLNVKLDLLLRKLNTESKPNE